MSEGEPNIRTLPTTMVVDAFPLEGPGTRTPEPEMPRRRSVGSYYLSAVLLALARPRVLLFLLGLQLILPLMVALPTFFSAEQHLSSVEAIPGGTAVDLPEIAPSWVFEEWFRAAPTEAKAAIQGLPALLLLVSLLQLVFTAGWMRLALREGRKHSLRIFLQSGGHFFFPFLRTWLLGLPLFAIATWVYWGLPGEWVFERLMPEGDPALAASERTGRWLEILRQVLYLLSLWKIEILLDLARASMICAGRRSALFALFRGIGFLTRSPMPVFGLMALGFGMELLWIAGVEAVRAALDWPIWTLLLLLPFGRIVLRAGRLIGLVDYYETRTREKSSAEGVGEDEADEEEDKASAHMAI
ncbi:MAG: hypothetical protein ACYTEP_11250 [Planctomycetota bacterium]|jgi:hypothetical protein